MYSKKFIIIILITKFFLPELFHLTPTTCISVLTDICPPVHNKTRIKKISIWWTLLVRKVVRCDKILCRSPKVNSAVNPVTCQG